MHSQPGLDLDVEVLSEGDWVRRRAIQSRRGDDGQETFVTGVPADGAELPVAGAWVHHSQIRAIHVRD